MFLIDLCWCREEGVEPPRPEGRRILSPYLRKIRWCIFLYLQLLRWSNSEVPCGPVRPFSDTLGIV
jgi:hypothetical protein